MPYGDKGEYTDSRPPDYVTAGYISVKAGRRRGPVAKIKAIAAAAFMSGALILAAACGGELQTQPGPTHVAPVQGDTSSATAPPTPTAAPTPTPAPTPDVQATVDRAVRQTLEAGRRLAATVEAIEATAIAEYRATAAAVTPTPAPVSDAEMTAAIDRVFDCLQVDTTAQLSFIELYSESIGATLGLADADADEVAAYIISDRQTFAEMWEAGLRLSYGSDGNALWVITRAIADACEVE